MQKRNLITFVVVIIIFIFVLVRLRNVSTVSLKITQPIHTVFTYYEPAIEATESLKLLSLWKLSWTAYGWNTVVLNREIAKLHPQYHQLVAKFRTLPTVNTKEYEMACYERWIAMVVVGGGFLSDFDVMNYGVTPSEILRTVDGNFTLMQNHIPALTHASHKEYKRVLKMMASYKLRDDDRIYGTPHISDMIMFVRLGEAGAVRTRNDLFEPDIQSSPLVHYSHGLTETSERAEKIKRMRYDSRWNKY